MCGVLQSYVLPDKKLSSANNHVSLREGHFPVTLEDESTTWTNTGFVTLVRILLSSPDFCPKEHVKL